MATATEDDGEQLCELMLTAAVPVRQCAAELSRSELASKVWLEMGRVHSTVPLGKVAELATTLDLAERVYAVVGLWKPAALPDAAPTGELLPLFKALVAAADHWAVAVAAWSRVHSGRAPATVRVVGKRAGSRYAALPSMELAGSLGAAIAIRLGVVIDLRSPDLEVTASLNDKGLLLSLALLRRPDSLEGRLPCRGLHPHVAWAMARCVLPLPPGAVLLDPMCGTAALHSSPHLHPHLAPTLALILALTLALTLTLTLTRCGAATLLYEALASAGGAAASPLALGCDASDAQLQRAAANRAALPAGLAPRLRLLRASGTALPLQPQPQP